MLAPRVRPEPRLVEEAARLLLEATTPLLLVGPEVTRSEAKPQVIELAQRLALPVAQAERLFDDFPTNHPLFLGDYSPSRVYPKGVDLILNLGGRMPHQMDELPPGTRVIHASIDAEQIGRVVPTDVGMVADVKEAAADLLLALDAAATKSRLDGLREARLEATRRYTEGQRAEQARATRARWDSTPLSWERVTGELSQLLDADAIIVPELAENTWEDPPWSWEGEFTFAPGAKSKIGRTTGSALGWGIGAAIGVKLARPRRQVVALQGDGGFMFAQAESLWTMARYEVPVLVVIFNNRSYNGPRNKIWMGGGRQAKSGKDMSCYLGDPDVDFAKVAAGFGVKGEMIAAPAEVRPAIQRGIQSTREGRPYLIDAVIGRTGLAADSTWYPRYSVAKL
jgi:thiamine pyrophosphate-dependent acetolactate synthase large subunit-like protein